MRIALTLSGLLACIAIVALIVRVGATTEDRERAAARERHGFEVLIATRSVETSMASAEAALGRFAISADRMMGATYYDEWMLAGAQIERLSRLVANDRDSTVLAARLRALYAARGMELVRPARRAAAHRGWEALDALNVAGHSPNIAAIDETLRAIQNRQRAALERRADQSEAAASIAGHLVSMLSLAGMLLVLVAGALGWLVSIVTTRNLEAEAEVEEAASRASWLRTAVDDRTAELRDANARLQREMTERLSAEAQLRQMQKMEAVGQLTGGIAHDFNNMLAVVVGSLDLARRRLDTMQADVASHIDHAMEGADRAAQLTRRLLGFARAEALTPARIEPRAAIADMSELFARTLGERITVRTRIARNCWPIWADPAQLENALLNLAVNGRDAMDGPGTIVVTANNVELEAGSVGSLRAGRYVRIAIGDSGAGIAPEVLERVFEPFFTTKPVGKGTGLGLSQVFGFVRESGGDVAIDSNVGRGTTVSLYLPQAGAADVATPRLAPAPVVRLPLAPAAPPEADGGERILLVEDDPRVRAATAEALVELGYAPICCDGADAALVALAEQPTVRLMVTDVVMPDRTGPELAAIVRAVRPDIRVLFVTGYTGDDGSELIGEAVLRKPFTIAALEAAIGGALDGAVNEPPPAVAIAAAG